MGSIRHQVVRLLGVSAVVFSTTCTDDQGPFEPGPAEPVGKAVSQLPEGPAVRLSRVIEPVDLGVGSPTGLAFSTTTGRLLVVSRPPETPPGTSTGIQLVSPFTDRDGTVQVAIGVTDPVNMTFDEAANRLLLFDGPSNALHEIRLKPDGRLDPQTLEQIDARSFGIEDPQGLTVDPVSGDLFILDVQGRRIVRVKPDPQSGFAGAVISEIDLRTQGLSDLRGLAMHPTSGSLFTLDPQALELHELTTNGQIVATHDISGFGLTNTHGMAFGPSGDSTDDPDEWSLYIADSGSGTDPAGSGSVAELSFDRGGIAAVTIAAATPASLVQTIDTWQFSPPSPDPAGIAYLSDVDHLLISDSEVNEMSIYAGSNLFEVDLSGNVVGTYTTVAYTSEPTGVTSNPANNHLFISDDNSDEIFEIDPGPDGVLHTGDDLVTSFETSDFGSTDPEGVTYDQTQGVLFIADGTDSEVYRVAPGANGIFDGVSPAGDDQVSSFDTEVHGLLDPEGIAWDEDFGHLYVVGDPETTVFHLTTDGTLVRTIDISPAVANKPAGLAYAPGSLNPDQMHLWIVDRRTDNNSDPQENDGQAYEFSVPPLSGNLLPVVTISAPSTGSSFIEGESITFTGTAMDFEDGVLTANLAWSSNRDGAIGTGGSFATSSLSIGTHTVTASVTDGGGLPGADAIAVTVRSGASTEIVFDERFEVTGYDEFWSEGETLGSGVSLDEDYATSLITGAPSDWDSEALEIVFAAGQDSYLEHLLTTTGHAVSYLRYEFIVSADDLANGDVNHILSVRGLGGEKMYQLMFARAGGQPYLTAQFYHDGSSNIYNRVISLDTRYRAEVYWNSDTDEWEYRVDGGTLASGSLTGTAASYELSYFRVGDVDRQQDAGATIYVDNVAFSTGNWLGAPTTPNSAPTASYTWSATDLTVDFTDTSTDGDGTIASWAWDFGDGNNSTAQNPQHTYASAGDYTVTLSVTDDDGASSAAPASQTVSPTAPNQTPTASYTWSATDLTVDFTDTSTDGDGTIASWAWDFGDGNNSTAQNPQHTYATAGDYTVTLTVTDDDGASSAAPASQTVSVTTTVILEVNALAPDTLAAGSTTSVTIAGSGFVPGAAVSFENGSGPGPTLESEPVVASDGGEITVTVNVKSGGPKRDRVWDVRVTNPDGSSAVLAGGLVITP
jgi:PKD repeat protein/uncharacterized protein YjiK